MLVRKTLVTITVDTELKWKKKRKHPCLKLYLNDDYRYYNRYRYTPNRLLGVRVEDTERSVLVDILQSPSSSGSAVALIHISEISPKNGIWEHLRMSSRCLPGVLKPVSDVYVVNGAWSWMKLVYGMPWGAILGASVSSKCTAAHRDSFAGQTGRQSL